MRSVGSALLVGRIPLRRVAATVLLLVCPAVAGAVPARERAVERIPELMGRILDSQEEIRARESEMAPVIQRYDESLAASKQRIDAAGSEDEAAEALVEYVEAYSARLDAQETGLRSIEASVVRMRADARDLLRAAESASDGPREEPGERRQFYQEHFQGVASATAQLAERLERVEDAATTGAVLHSSWGSYGSLDLPVPELGPDGAAAFARKVEGLYARFQARTNQLRAERNSVRHLLDLLIERQLAQRLDSLFDGDSVGGIGALFAGSNDSQDWQDLGYVVARTLGLPSGGAGVSGRTSASLDRLNHFARGNHRSR